jgi:SAM-dependent methyltransferase
MALYDKVADNYDRFYGDAECQVENDVIKNFLQANLQEGMVIDIGCGTGLMADMGLTQPRAYVGIDPSEKMLEVFKQKHPSYYACLDHTTCENHMAERVLAPTDNVVSLFGSISYVEQPKLHLLAKQIKKSGCKYFLMFLRSGYHSRVLQDAGIKAKYNNPNEVFDLFAWGDYLIATNLKWT